MEKIPFHYSPTVPGAIDAFRWDQRGRVIEDVTLTNTEINSLQIAEMGISILKISLVDEDGNEMPILHYKKPTKLRLHGIASGKSISIRNLRELAPGRYMKVRFYVDGDVNYKSRIWEERTIEGREFIEFEFEKTLEVWDHESPEFTFRFSFAAFQRKSTLEYFKKWTFLRKRAKWTF